MASESTHLVNIKQGDLSAVSGIDKVNASLKQAQTEASKAGSALAQATKSNQLYELSKSADVSRVALTKMRAELVKLGATDDEIKKVALSIQNNYRNAVQGATEDVRRLTKEVKEVGTADFGREAIGDVSTFGSSVASVLGAGGQNAGSELFAFGGDFAGVLEYTGKFKDAVAAAGDAAFENEGAFTKLSTTIFTAIPGISGTAAGLTAMALAAAPFVIAGAAVVGAIVAVTSAYEEQKRMAAEAAEASLQGLDSETKARFLAQRARFDELKEIQATEEETAALATATYVAQFEELQRLSKSTIGDLVKEFGGMTRAKAEIDRLTTAVQESGKAQTEAQQKYEGVKKVTEEYSDQIQRHTAFTEQQALLTSDTAKEAEKLNAEYERSIATIAQLKQQQDDLNTSYREAGAAVLARRQLEDRRRNEDSGKTARRAQEDLDRALASAETAHEDNLLAIQQRGNDAILAARIDLAKKEADAVEQIGKLQAQFRDDQAKAEAEYFKNRKRDTEDYHRDRIRAEQDFARSQLEGLINNDITSLVLDQGAFDLEQQRARQDRRIGRRRGKEDFLDDRAEAEAALAQKIADINAELAEYQIATAAKILAIQTQTSNDLILAQQAYDARLALDADERKIKADRDAEDLRITNERRTQDRQAEDMARLLAHHKALEQISEKALLEQSIADGLKFKLLEVQQLLQSTSAGVMNLANGLPIQGGGNYTGAGGSQINAPPITSPIGPSTVKPFSPQLAGRNNPGGRGGDGGNMSIQITPQVVEIGGMQFVPYTVFEDSINAVINGIHRARNQRAG